MKYILLVLVMIMMMTSVSGLGFTATKVNRHTPIDGMMKTHDSGTSGGLGSAIHNCQAPEGFGREKGAVSCFDARLKRNIRVMSIGEVCPIVNHDFLVCMTNNYDHEFNRDRDWQTALNYWGNWVFVQSSHKGFVGLTGR